MHGGNPIACYRTGGSHKRDGGYAHYSGGTLTLNNANVTGAASGDDNRGIYADGDLTIMLVGDSTVTARDVDNGSSYGICVEGTLAIDGSGSLTAGDVSRTGNAEAMVKFTSDEAGTYYYAVVESGAEAPNIDTAGVGTACDTSEQTISLTNLTTMGAKDIYIVVKDAVGNVSDKLKLTIPEYIAPMYSISADTTEIDFGCALEGYTSLPSLQKVTITNTGNQPITLTQPTATKYTVSALSKTDLAVGEAASFTVQPNSGLSVGTYNETIIVQGANGDNSTNEILIEAKFEVRMEEQPPYTGLVRDENGDWIYVTDDVKDTTKTGLVQYETAWFYVKEGELDTTANGFVEYDGEKFFVAGGQHLTTVNGLTQDPATGDWYYVDAGMIQAVSDMVSYDGSWFVVKDGKLDVGFSGLYEYDGSKFLIGSGMLQDKAATGLQMCGDAWYYLIDGGQVADHTGLALYGGEWFYVGDGKYQNDYTGAVEYNGETFHVVNGQVIY